MITKNETLNLVEAQGTADALDLRNRSPEMDGTAIIAEEDKIPQFDGEKDYTTWVIGSPVYELIDGEKQVFTLIQPHNASYYPTSTPQNTPALWSIRHTKDPKKAKPFMTPQGISGMYEIDECCTENGRVFKNIRENNVYPPSVMPTDWEDLGAINEQV